MTTMRIFCLTILFVIHLQAIFICAEDTYTHLPLHKRMDPSLLKQTFHVESYDEVPAYEVVQVHPVPVRSRRSADNEGEVLRVHLSAFGRDMQLQLHKNDDFDAHLKTMKMYMAESTNNGILYEEMAAEDYDPGTPYQDLDQMAAVIIRDGSDGEIQMEGTIGNNLVVKPLPTALLVPKDGFFNDEMFLDEDKSYERTGNSTWHHPRANTTSARHLHFVYRDYIIFESQSDFVFLDFVRGGRFNPSRQTKRTVPYTVYPEILILVDYQSFVLHGNYIKGYVASIWNGVDLRFKTLSSPEIRISLVGVIVAKNKDAMPFLEHNRLAKRDAIDVAAAITDMSKYLYLERNRMPDYDLAVVMTKLDMCEGKDSRSCNVAGFAYIGGACNVDKRQEKVKSVAIIEVSGPISDILVAAHEVGHLLGSMHDGDSETPLGGPEATRCPGKDGFIMGSQASIYDSGLWSECSVLQFKHFFSTKAASCLFNIPDVNKLLNSTHVKPAYKPPTKKPHKPQHPQTEENREVCEDAAEKVAGEQFCQRLLLRPNGNWFCGQNYVKKNCCRSHKILCSK